ncbi:hypothetical protein H072_7725 [Dactylellina haptotyla CBS 200.50]|uniref:Aminoglycoside phosphotransferase domain-containing protein n=1 Tax=Dactylellina haptotyla (strain CBS 200.50) TaxID=1284197 RepID=S8BTE9_DACHA|nr:hypothetical protein H072_7725 [Dactylellina haptotyla CBS 200.50]
MSNTNYFQMDSNSEPYDPLAFELPSYYPPGPPSTPIIRDSWEREWPLESIAIGRCISAARNFKGVFACETEFGKTVAVKVGWATQHEINVLRMLKEHGFVYSPKFNAFYMVEGWPVIVMELMPGTPLSYGVWWRMDELERENFKNQLFRVMSEFRSITSDRVEGVGGSQVYLSHGELGGPYNSEEELIADKLKLLEAINANTQISTYPPGGVDLNRMPKDIEYARMLVDSYNKMPRKPAKFVSTHGYLSPDNILVDAEGNITGLVGFRKSSFMPEYCELGLVLLQYSRWWDQVLVEVMGHVVPEYPWDHPMVMFEIVVSQLVDDMSNYRFPRLTRHCRSIEEWVYIVIKNSIKYSMFKSTVIHIETFYSSANLATR